MLRPVFAALHVVGYSRAASLSLKLGIVISAIMRRRRSLVGLSLIEGPVLRLEFGTPRSSGRDRSRHSLDQLLSPALATCSASARSRASGFVP
jgi:hypothetical protein